MRTNEEILRERAAQIARENSADNKVVDELHLVGFLLYPEKYAIETAYVREVLATKEITPLPGTPAYMIGILHLKGSVVSVIDLKTLFGLKEIGLTGTNKLILLKNDHMEFALLVDEAAINRNEQLITTQRQLQEANETLQAVNSELDNFARTVSHDLKSPLNGVIGFTNLLQSSYDDVLDDTGKEYLHWILESAQTMVHLIDDLLMFSYTARKDITREPVDLSALAREVILVLQRSNYQKDYSVTIQENITTIADSGLMRVVLTNLLGNAIKYSKNTPRPELIFGSKMMGDKQIVYVKDNGAGFDMSKADELFKPFVRLHSGETYQGTGVGLSTVKRIIERHGGAIWFEAEVDKGATFYFTLE